MTIEVQVNGLGCPWFTVQEEGVREWRERLLRLWRGRGGWSFFHVMEASTCIDMQGSIRQKSMMESGGGNAVSLCDRG